VRHGPRASARRWTSNLRGPQAAHDRLLGEHHARGACAAALHLHPLATITTYYVADAAGLRGPEIRDPALERFKKGPPRPRPAPPPPAGRMPDRPIVPGDPLPAIAGSWCCLKAGCGMKSAAQSRRGRAGQRRFLLQLVLKAASAARAMASIRAAQIKSSRTVRDGVRGSAPGSSCSRPPIGWWSSTLAMLGQRVHEAHGAVEIDNPYSRRRLRPSASSCQRGKSSAQRLASAPRQGRKEPSQGTQCFLTQCAHGGSPFVPARGGKLRAIVLSTSCWNSSAMRSTLKRHGSPLGAVCPVDRSHRTLTRPGQGECRCGLLLSPGR